MKSIDIFYQVEGIADIQHCEVGPGATFGELSTELVKKHGLDRESSIFVEDDDEAVEGTTIVRDRATAAGVKVHVHRCRQVVVTVTFNAETVERRFGPGTTIARVKRWAAQEQFGMTKEEAGEHVLQIVGTHDRPAANVHIGTLASCPACRVAFHLVPDERINGASGATE